MPKFSLQNIEDSVKQAQSTTNALKFKPYQENIPMAEIVPHPENNFAENDTPADIQEMAEDIKLNGLINPLTVHKVNGKYRLLSGERRFRALQLLGWTYVRSTVYVDLTPAEELRILFAANLKARTYTAAQRMQYYEVLRDRLAKQKELGQYDGPLQMDIAETMGVSDRQVRKYERISENLSADEKKRIAQGEISVDAAYQLAQKKNNGKKKKESDTGREAKTGSASGFVAPKTAEAHDESRLSDADDRRTGESKPDANAVQGGTDDRHEEICGAYAEAWRSVRKLRRYFALDTSGTDVANQLHSVIMELSSVMEAAGYQLGIPDRE